MVREVVRSSWDDCGLEHLRLAVGNDAAVADGVAWV